MEETTNSNTPQSTGQFIEELNEQLDEQSSSNANRAFNLGCLLGTIPALLIVLITYFVSKGAWVPIVFIAALMMVAVLLFANLAAYTARNRTMDRVYEEQIEPQIKSELEARSLEESEFNNLAREELPEGASLLNYIEIEPQKSDLESVNDNKS